MKTLIGFASVAQAIYDRTLEVDQLADFSLPFADAKTCAIAAIKAMQKPTKDMLETGQACLDCVPINHCVEQANKVWRGMIDHILVD